jgi:hypothetical protein
MYLESHKKVIPYGFPAPWKRTRKGRHRLQETDPATPHRKLPKFLDHGATDAGPENRLNSWRFLLALLYWNVFSKHTDISKHSTGAEMGLHN